jgi:hypothetical protein
VRSVARCSFVTSVNPRSCSVIVCRRSPSTSSQLWRHMTRPAKPPTRSTSHHAPTPQPQTSARQGPDGLLSRRGYVSRLEACVYRS